MKNSAPLLLDDQGRPQVFYHGTQRVFEQIRPNALGLIHFSSSRVQAGEFSEHPRGGCTADGLGAPTVWEAYLRVRRLFDPKNRMDTKTLIDRLDLNQVAIEAEEAYESPWPESEMIEWLASGQWQMLELPSILPKIQEMADGLVMYELGCRNIAVFRSDQVEMIGIAKPMVVSKPGRRP